MQKLNQSYIKFVVKKALDEDLKPRGDITTNLIKFKNKKAKAQIIAKQDGIIAGLDFLNHTSGIATLTNQFKQKVNKKTKICCTRKTTPNLRLLEKYAVKKGGGHNHRYNLSDEILIKDNHISSEENLRDLVRKAIKTKKIVTVEIENLKQLTENFNIYTFGGLKETNQWLEKNNYA